MSIITKLAGVTFNNAQENINRFGFQDVGGFALVREPENLYDENAIRVVFCGLFMGYIPSKLSQVIAPMIDEGERYYAKFISRNESPFHETVGLTVQIVEM